jgi:hypothetical protein
LRRAADTSRSRIGTEPISTSLRRILRRIIQCEGHWTNASPKKSQLQSDVLVIYQKGRKFHACFGQTIGFDIFRHQLRETSSAIIYVSTRHNDGLFLCPKGARKGSSDCRKTKKSEKACSLLGTADSLQRRRSIRYSQTAPCSKALFPGPAKNKRVESAPSVFRKSCAPNLMAVSGSAFAIR